jgi:hypothetical protein
MLRNLCKTQCAINHALSRNDGSRDYISGDIFRPIL